VCTHGCCQSLPPLADSDSQVNDVLHFSSKCYTRRRRVALDPFTEQSHLSELTLYTVFQKNPYDYVFDDNLNSRRPIVIIFGTVIT